MEKHKLQVEMGKRIKAAMALAGIETQKEFAKLIGINECQLVRYIKGRFPVPHHILQEIAQATGQPIQFFFPGE